MLHLWIIASITMLPLLIIPTMLVVDWYKANTVRLDPTVLAMPARSSYVLDNIVRYTKD